MQTTMQLSVMLVGIAVGFLGACLAQYVAANAAVGIERVRRHENVLKEMSAAWTGRCYELIDAVWRDAERMEATGWVDRRPSREVMVARYGVRLHAEATQFDMRAERLVAWLGSEDAGGPGGELNRARLELLIESLIDAVHSGLDEAATSESMNVKPSRSIPRSRPLESERGPAQPVSQPSN